MHLNVYPSYEMEPDSLPNEISEAEMATVMKKIKKNKDIVPQTVDMLKRNPDLERDATNMVMDIDGIVGGKMGMDTPLKERKKMMARQELVKSQMKHRLKEGETKCVSMLLNGKVCPYAVDCSAIEKEEKYKTGAVAIKGKDYMYILDSQVKPVKNKLNKRATMLLMQPVYGIAHFVLLDSDFSPEDSTVTDFPK